MLKPLLISLAVLWALPAHGQKVTITIESPYTSMDMAIVPDFLEYEIASKISSSSFDNFGGPSGGINGAGPGGGGPSGPPPPPPDTSWGPWEFKGTFGDWAPNSTEKYAGEAEGTNTENIDVKIYTKTTLHSEASLSSSLGVGFSGISASVSSEIKQWIAWEYGVDITFKAYCGHVKVTFFSKTRDMSVYWKRYAFSYGFLVDTQESWGSVNQADPNVIPRFTTL